MGRLSALASVCIVVATCGALAACSQRASAIEADAYFMNARDRVRLSGTLVTPEGRGPFPAILLVHGSGPHTRDMVFGSHRWFASMADHLAQRGIASLRYDKRGCGLSGGRYEPYDLDSLTEDALAGLAWLAKHPRIDSRNVGALGISEGGLIVPAMAVRSASVQFAVLMAAPGVWGKEFAVLSSMALSRASGHKVEPLGPLYDRFWPLYLKPHLTAPEEAEARQLLAMIAGFMDPESRALLNMGDAQAFLAAYRSPKVLAAMKLDPCSVLRRVRCPVLALNGSLDTQIPAQVNLAAISRALREGGNRDYVVTELSGLNHVFQRCRTGLPSEYVKTEETIAPVALETISSWILRVTGRSGGNGK